MNDSKKYLDCLLEGVEKKRTVSIKEFYKTDLNRSTNLDNVNAWYARLAQMIEQNPPHKFVRGLKIYEDNQGEIKTIEYDYSEAEKSDTSEITFTFYGEEQFQNFVIN